MERVAVISAPDVCSVLENGDFSALEPHYKVQHIPLDSITQAHDHYAAWLLISDHIVDRLPATMRPRAWWMWGDLPTPSCVPVVQTYDQVFLTDAVSAHRLTELGAANCNHLPLPADPAVSRDRTVPMFDVCVVGRATDTACITRLFPKRLRTCSHNDPQNAASRKLPKARLTVLTRPDAYRTCFNAMSSGSVVLVPRQSRWWRDYFTDGTHVVSYSDPLNCVRTACILLARQQLRTVISERANLRVRHDHTLAARLRHMLRGLPRQRVLCPTQHSRPLISLCMIVRDSQRTLGAALEGVRDSVDEMIVVDTGSCDATVQIAQEMGASVSHFTWIDDFAAARNASIDRANGEWIFWMDADDTIDKTDATKLRQFALDASSSTAGFVIPVHCLDPRSDGCSATAVDHVKLFRNRPEFRFEGRIHEQILPSILRAGGAVAWTDVRVIHAGADYSPAGRARKRERDTRILELELSERPADTFILFNLGMTHADAGEYARAADFLRRSLAFSTASESHVPKLYAILISCMTKQNLWKEASAICNEALSRYPDDTELNFHSGIVCQSTGRFEDAIAFYKAASKRPQVRRLSSVDQGIWTFKADFNLAGCYAELGLNQQAEGLYRSVVERRPFWQPGWDGLLDCLLRRGNLGEATRQLELLSAIPTLQRCATHWAAAVDCSKSRHSFQRLEVADPPLRSRDG